jgi:single-strand DNA-binding protein
MRVIATGRLKQHSYQTQDGSQRTVIDMTIDEIGPSLRYATAQVTRVQSGRGYSGGSTYGDPAKPANGQGWQNSSPAQNPGMPEDDPWAQTAPASPGATFGTSNDFPSNDSDPEF